MKIVFLTLLLSMTSVYAGQASFFEETQEVMAPFSNNVNQKNCEDCDDPSHRNSHLFSEEKSRNDSAHYISWKRYKANFGKDQVLVLFPEKPAVSQSNCLLTGYAYDHAVLYTFNGYLPPLKHIQHARWFEEVLTPFNVYPLCPISHIIFQTENGNWVMDYLAQDALQNLIIKGRAIVTPHNGYTLQCIKPNGAVDHFDYFLDNFHVKKASE